MKKIKAEIKKSSDCLWVVIDGDDKTAWAITEEELVPVRDAINKYLERNEKP